MIDWASICGLPHEQVDDSGLGIVLYDRGEDGEGAKRCENCVAIRDDWRGWLLVHGYEVAA